MYRATSDHLHHLVDRLANYSSLSEAERNAILNLPMEVEYARPNIDLVRLGERVEHSCLVADGLIARFDQDSNVQRQITTLHIAGEIPDLHLLVLPHAPFALQALAPTTILKIPHCAIRTTAAAHPVVAEALRNCMVDAMILTRLTINTGHRDAECRLAYLICEMAARYKGAHLSGRVVYDLPMTQAHLAAATGLESVHVSQALEAHGVEVRQGTVYITEWNRLAQAAGFAASYHR